jgi:predicted HAD superfamily Cof-like phosphohydrolase
MNKEQKMVQDFHNKLNCLVNYKPTVPDKAEMDLRSKLIAEELLELVTAFAKRDLIGAVDALGDLLYVVYGAGVMLGVDLEPVFKEIHRSNMTKAGAKRNEHGKIMKGPAYQPPLIWDIISEQWGDQVKVKGRGKSKT